MTDRPKTPEEMQLSGTAKWKINPFKDLTLKDLAGFPSMAEPEGGPVPGPVGSPVPEPEGGPVPKPNVVAWNPWKEAKAKREAKAAIVKGKHMTLQAFSTEMSTGVVSLIKSQQAPGTRFMLMIGNDQEEVITSSLTREQAEDWLKRTYANMKKT